MIMILYEDNDIIVCIKPAGISSQSERSFQADMVSLLMNRLSENGIASPYIGVIHRLDKPVSGVMVYAKNKKAASSLCRQLQNFGFNKHYYAVTCDKIAYTPEDYANGTYRDYIFHEKHSNVKLSRATVSAVAKPGFSEAILNYKILRTEHFPDIADTMLSVADITLITGRYHQIRAQFAHHGHPILGDRKYSENFKYKTDTDKISAPALFAYHLSFKHPASGKIMDFKYDIFQDSNMSPDLSFIPAGFKVFLS